MSVPAELASALGSVTRDEALQAMRSAGHLDILTADYPTNSDQFAEQVLQLTAIGAKCLERVAKMLDMIEERRSASLVRIGRSMCVKAVMHGSDGDEAEGAGS